MSRTEALQNACLTASGTCGPDQRGRAAIGFGCVFLPPARSVPWAWMNRRSPSGARHV